MNRFLKPGALALLITIVAAACTKIENTTLGGDLIPSVDNINTFDTVLEVIATNEIPDDSTRIFASDAHIAGAIDNDPQFGSSRSSLFFEMKPASFPYVMSTDSITQFDSAVLVLDYLGYYGDSSSPVTLRLYEANKKVNADTSVKPYYTFNPDLAPNTARFLGQKTMRPLDFRDTINIKRGDSLYKKVTRQLRIPLDRNFAQALFRQDTSATGAFRSDSLFKEYLNGFALQCEGPANALLYFQMNGANSGIEFYYRAKILLSGKIDTTSARMPFTSFSGHAMKFERNRGGAEILNHLVADPTKGASQLYIQNAPGTVVKIKIPGLKTLTNRIIHRAELRVTEMTQNTTDPYFSQLLPPTLLYLDVADTGNVYKGIPYDMAPLTNYFCFPSGTIEFFYFGGPTKREVVNGELLARYYMNMTRYIQGVVTRKEPVYDFRLSSPYYLWYQNCNSNTFSYPTNVFRLLTTSNQIANLPGNGRIRLAGSNHPDPNKKLQLRIIYSKL
ncbi:DUF4270 family protein [Phnomibacter ginsenosidimutans]|uniref:DUF4270 family protein n=1 Tax=Phnomibacter ginsenosidimutans TaxID=2676868 RepID=UPI0018D26D66|nr:DUF4270 family protein [Phnomibacter ginsenosidimutans]